MGKTITLIEGGRYDYQILVANNASQTTRWACFELQRILRKMTGVTLPISQELEGDGHRSHMYMTRGIIVGRHPRLETIGAKIDWDTLGDEGYRLTTCGEDIIVAGSDVRGAMYGVFSLLEKYMGVRWFTPDVEHVPTRYKVTLPADLEETFVPQLEYREPQFWENYIDGDWNAHTKGNGHYDRVADYQGGTMKYFPFVHSFNALVPVEKYFDEHPEYFSMVDGKRISDHTQLCLTNDEVFEIALKQVKEWIQTHPEASIVSVSQNDWYNPCQCEKCKAIDDYEGSHAGTLLTFVNKIAAAIAEEYPHIAIDTLAYQYTRKPPKHIRPLPNVIIRLCDIECCFSHPLEECQAIAYPSDTPERRPAQHFSEDIRQWAQVSDRLYVWDYVTNYAHPLMPFPNFKVLKPNIQFLIKNHVKGLFEEAAYWGGGGASMAELRSYVMAQLMWNPDYDVDTLVDEFLAGVFKGAAPAMRRYYDLIHSHLDGVHMGIYEPKSDAYKNPEIQKQLEELKRTCKTVTEFNERSKELNSFRLTVEKLEFLTQPMLDEAHRLFDEMELVADDEIVLRRVRRERLGLRYIELYLEDPKSPEHKANVDEFFADLKSHGIDRLSEGRLPEQSYEMMVQGIMRTWG